MESSVEARLSLELSQAESLLSACECLRKVISTVKLATLGEENLIRK